MPRVRFTEEPKLPRDMKYLGYKKDLEFNMSEDEANRWIRRGCAEVVTDAKPVREAEKKEAIVIQGLDKKPIELDKKESDSVTGGTSTMSHAASITSSPSQPTPSNSPSLVKK